MFLGLCSNLLDNSIFLSLLSDTRNEWVKNYCLLIYSCYFSIPLYSMTSIIIILLSVSVELCKYLKTVEDFFSLSQETL